MKALDEARVRNAEESQDENELESDLSELSDLDDEDNPLSSAKHPMPPGSPNFYLSDAEEVAPSNCHPTQPTAATGKTARRNRKNQKKRIGRNIKRAMIQRELGTSLKGVSRRRSAASTILEVDKSFVTEDLPVNSGGWSGVRENFEKSCPTLEELLGEDYGMELVDWNGKYVFLSSLPFVFSTDEQGDTCHH